MPAAQDETAPSPQQAARAASANPRRRASLAGAELGALGVGRASERLQALAAALLGNLLAASTPPEAAGDAMQQVSSFWRAVRANA